MSVYGRIFFFRIFHYLSTLGGGHGRCVTRIWYIKFKVKPREILLMLHTYEGIFVLFLLFVRLSVDVDSDDLHLRQVAANTDIKLHQY